MDGKENDQWLMGKASACAPDGRERKRKKSTQRNTPLDPLSRKEVGRSRMLRLLYALCAQIRCDLRQHLRLGREGTEGEIRLHVQELEN